MYALLDFKAFQKLFSLLPYTIVNFLFASLKLVTNFENVYLNSLRIFLLCDWSIFSSDDLSLAGGKMRKN